ncbi:hypothetical protein PM082_000325 [Marasmius tenuissimus]|nr:hypothetical protein PM082_000325 [Marasmius tenuissimus]
MLLLQPLRSGMADISTTCLALLHPLRIRRPLNGNGSYRARARMRVFERGGLQLMVLQGLIGVDQFLLKCGALAASKTTHRMRAARFLLHRSLLKAESSIFALSKSQSEHVCLCAQAVRSWMINFPFCQPPEERRCFFRAPSFDNPRSRGHPFKHPGYWIVDAARKTLFQPQAIPPSSTLPSPASALLTTHFLNPVSAATQSPTQRFGTVNVLTAVHLEYEYWLRMLLLSPKLIERRFPRHSR